MFDNDSRSTNSAGEGYRKLFDKYAISNDYSYSSTTNHIFNSNASDSTDSGFFELKVNPNKMDFQSFTFKDIHFKHANDASSYSLIQLEVYDTAGKIIYAGEQTFSQEDNVTEISDIAKILADFPADGIKYANRVIVKFSYTTSDTAPSATEFDSFTAADDSDEQLPITDYQIDKLASSIDHDDLDVDYSDLGLSVVGRASVDPIDQETLGIPTSHGGSNNTGQSFVAGKTGYMYDLELFMYQSNAPSTKLTIEILEGQNMNGSVLGTASFNSTDVPSDPGGWIPVTFTNGVYLEAGKTYTIKMTSPTGTNQILWKLHIGNVYGSGKAYNSGGWSTDSDFAFRTYVAAAQRNYSTVLTVPSGTDSYGETVQLTADLTNAGTALASQTILFSVDGSPVGTAQTNGSGRASISYLLNLAPGNYTVTASFAGNGPYQASNETGTLTVYKKQLTITADNASMLYGNAIPNLTASYSGLAPWDTPASVGTPTFSTTATSASSVGAYFITPSNVTSSNYIITYVPGTLTIGKRPLSVTPNSVTRWANYDNSLLTGVLSGVVGTDGITVRYKTVADQSSPVGRYAIEVELIDPQNRLGNYDVTVTPMELVVYAAPQPIFSSGDTVQMCRNNKVV